MCIKRPGKEAPSMKIQQYREPVLSVLSVINVCRLIDADRNLIEVHAWDCLISDAFDRNLGDSLPALQEREFPATVGVLQLTTQWGGTNIQVIASRLCSSEPAIHTTRKAHIDGTDVNADS